MMTDYKILNPEPWIRFVYPLVYFVKHRQPH